MDLSDHIEQRDKQKINSKAFAIPILTVWFMMVDEIAVRIGIANALELNFCLFLCFMITELYL